MASGFRGIGFEMHCAVEGLPELRATTLDVGVQLVRLCKVVQLGVFRCFGLFVALLIFLLTLQALKVLITQQADVRTSGFFVPRSVIV